MEHSIYSEISTATTESIGRDEDEVVIDCYEKKIPAFIESQLDKLYVNFFSSIAHLRAQGKLENAHAYVACTKEKVIAVFLFHRERHMVRVLSEGIKLDEKEVSRFCRYIFSTYDAIGMVCFHAVQLQMAQAKFPYQSVNCLEDIVLSLPSDPEDYLNSLGKATRKTIRFYCNKFRRHFPSFHSRTYVQDEIVDEHVREIVAMSRDRITKQNKVFAIDDRATERIIELAKSHGMACVGFIDGKVCAGSISYRIGPNYFMHISSHDPQYDNYRLGTLYCYLSICECIKSGGKECHLLWGRQEYKYRLLGVRNDLDRVIFYRTRFHMLLNADTFLRTLFSGWRRKVALWAQEAMTKEDFRGRAVGRLLNFVRGTKVKA